jgi:hypothetical protein
MAKAKTAAQRIAQEEDAFPRDQEETEKGVRPVRKKPDFTKGRKLSFRIDGWWRPVKGETVTFLYLGSELRRGENAVDEDGAARRQIIGQLLDDATVQRVNAKKDDEGNSLTETAHEGSLVSFGDYSALKPLLDLEGGGKYAVQIEVKGRNKAKTGNRKFWDLDVTYTDAG